MAFFHNCKSCICLVTSVYHQGAVIQQRKQLLSFYFRVACHQVTLPKRFSSSLRAVHFSVQRIQIIISSFKEFPTTFMSCHICSLSLGSAWSFREEFGSTPALRNLVVFLASIMWKFVSQMLVHLLSEKIIQII